MAERLPAMEAGRSGSEAVLMRTLAFLYHDIVPRGRFSISGFQSPDADIYKLDCGEFEKHLKCISEVLDTPPDGSPEARVNDDFRVLLTFDDGGVSASSYTADLLEQFGWRGYFFVTTDWINRPGFLSESQISDLYRRGHIIGSHSCSHPPRMSRCSRQQLDREWQQSVQRLTQTLDAEVSSASVPGGYFSREVAAAAAAAGIRCLFTSEPVASRLEIEGCSVFGRFSVQQGVSADWVSALAAGQASPRIQRYLFWNAKKVIKTLGGQAWLRLRQEVLARRTGDR